jgi:hypothetical protein
MKGSAAEPADHLGQNIYLSDVAFVPQKNAGLYKLNGENNSIVEFNSNSSSMFNTLNSGSEISNLKILNSNLVESTQNNIGVLAGINAGKITNVTIRDTALGVTTSMLTGTSTYFVGGLTGVNYGIISNSQISTNININGDRVLSARLYTGGIAGESLGSIISTRVNGEINRSAYSTNLIDDTYIADHSQGIAEITGGIVGYASGGNISEVRTDNSIIFNPTNANLNVLAAPAYGETPANTPVTLQDFYLGTRLNLSNSPIVFNHFNLRQINGNLVRGVFELKDTQTANLINDFSGYDNLAAQANVLYVYSGGGTMPSNSNIINVLHFDRTASGAISYTDSLGQIASFGNFNIGTDFISSIKNGNIWRIDFRGGAQVMELPKLVKTEGSFDEIGKGF